MRPRVYLAPILLSAVRQERQAVGFVVRVIDNESGGSRWIAPFTPIGVRRMGQRDEARVFPTQADAEFEVEIFRELSGEKFRFEVEVD